MGITTHREKPLRSYLGTSPECTVDVAAVVLEAGLGEIFVFLSGVLLCCEINEKWKMGDEDDNEVGDGSKGLTDASVDSKQASWRTRRLAFSLTVTLLLDKCILILLFGDCASM